MYLPHRFPIDHCWSNLAISAVTMQHTHSHSQRINGPVYNMSNYLNEASHRYPQVEDFPAQNVRQKSDDYRKGKATTRRHNLVTDMEEDLWNKCNKLLRAEKKLSKLFIASTCIHVIVLVFVTISVSLVCNHVIVL